MQGGFPGGASGKEPICQCKRCKRHEFDPCVRKIPWRRKQQPTPVFLPGKSHGQRRLEGYSTRGCKWSDTTEQLSTNTNYMQGTADRSPNSSNTNGSLFTYKLTMTLAIRAKIQLSGFDV